MTDDFRYMVEEACVPMRRLLHPVRTSVVLAGALLALQPGLAAQRLGWEELRNMVERSIHLRAPDAQTAARLRKVEAVEAVPAEAVEAAASWDAGPLTQQELRRLAERSASRPAPGRALALRQNPRGRQPVSGGEAAVVVETVRLYAQEYSASIPNFLCFRNTRFLKDSSPLGRWNLDAELKEKLSHVGNDDEHEIIAINGKAVEGRRRSFRLGLTVSGEFGNVMRRVFEPGTETAFYWMGADPEGDANRAVLGFRVEEEHSSMRIRASGEGEVTKGYSGEVLVSPATGQIFRIRLTMDALPEGHPIRGLTWDIRYGPVRVEERELLLPVAAAVEAYQQGRFVRNEATYTDYQQYVADSQIRFEGTAEPPE